MIAPCGRGPALFRSGKFVRAGPAFVLWRVAGADRAAGCSVCPPFRACCGPCRHKRLYSIYPRVSTIHCISILFHMCDTYHRGQIAAVSQKWVFGVIYRGKILLLYAPGRGRGRLVCFCRKRAVRCVKCKIQFRACFRKSVHAVL